MKLRRSNDLTYEVLLKLSRLASHKSKLFSLTYECSQSVIYNTAPFLLPYRWTSYVRAGEVTHKSIPAWIFLPRHYTENSLQQMLNFFQ
jgi:hypothetical protein